MPLEHHGLAAIVSQRCHRSSKFSPFRSTESHSCSPIEHPIRCEPMSFHPTNFQKADKAHACFPGLSGTKKRMLRWRGEIFVMQRGERNGLSRASDCDQSPRRKRTAPFEMHPADAYLLAEAC